MTVSRTIKTTAMALLMATAFSGAAWAKLETKIDAMTPLSSMPMQMVESGDKVFFMTPNGRYVIKGELIDVWNNNAPIKTVAQFKQVDSVVKLDALGVKMDELFHLKYGTGPEQVTIFVAPGCGYCKKTLAQMESVKDQYTFNIIPLPIMGPRSEDAVQRVIGNWKSDPEKALAAIMSDSYDALPKKQVSPEVMESFGKALLTAQILGVDSVPMLIDHKARVSKGAPPVLADHLKR